MPSFTVSQPARANIPCNPSWGRSTSNSCCRTDSTSAGQTSTTAKSLACLDITMSANSARRFAYSMPAEESEESPPSFFSLLYMLSPCLVMYIVRRYGCTLAKNCAILDPTKLLIMLLATMRELKFKSFMNIKSSSEPSSWIVVKSNLKSLMISCISSSVIPRIEHKLLKYSFCLELLSSRAISTQTNRACRSSSSLSFIVWRARLDKPPHMDFRLWATSLANKIAILPAVPAVTCAVPAVAKLS
mmetsp:Transcript_3539/g.8820  ORF Transcript_3539/g.8820 Transcript_3539/m.8820 type:complete len:245 (-) Transcript_3539:757-1491(-)